LDHRLADHSPVVLAPAGDHWVELPDQIFLASGLVVPKDFAELRIGALDGCPTEFDQGFEAPFGIVATHGRLTDLKAQEIKTRFASLGVQGVGDTGLRGMEFQA
jgi:hypothetical protein